MEAVIRVCKQCQKPIDLSKGRRDRLFCDELCKNKFHNTQSWMEEREFKRIKLILIRNRRILKKMIGRKDANELHKDKLLKAGFEFEFHTHFVTSKVKKYQYTFCFDYGYRAVTSNSYKVVKAFDYKED